MAPSMRRSLVLLALTSTSSQAQDLFLMPSSGDAPSSVMSFSSSSVMGSDGHLHTQTHKVISETSMDGKRVSNIDCKDGDCSESVSIMGNGPASLSSMMPSMPSFFDRVGMPPMPQMHSLRGRMPDWDMAGMERMKGVMARMEGLRHHMMHHMGHNMRPMKSMPFLAPRPDGVEQPVVEVVVMDATPEEAYMNAPPMPPPTVQSMQSGAQAQTLVPVMFAGLAFVGMVFTIILAIRSCCFGKAQARERPLQALGEPLAPEAEAELGVVTGTVVHPQAFAVPLPAKTPATGATQAYLLDLYPRAAKRSSAELAASVLHDIYATATEKVVAATA